MLLCNFLNYPMISYSIIFYAFMFYRILYFRCAFHFIVSCLLVAFMQAALDKAWTEHSSAVRTRRRLSRERGISRVLLYNLMLRASSLGLMSTWTKQFQRTA